MGATGFDALPPTQHCALPSSLGCCWRAAMCSPSLYAADSKVKCANPACSPRGIHPNTDLERQAAAALGGKIYACGGTSDSQDALATVEVYDPVTGVWSHAAPMNRARGAATANVFKFAL